MNSPRNHVHTAFLLLILAAALAMAYIVLSPFVHIIVIGIVLAALFHPVFRRLRDLLRGRGGVAALLTVALIFMLIILPFFFFLGALATQGVQTVTTLQQKLTTTDFNALLSHEHIAPYLEWIKTHLPFLDLGKLDLQADLLDLSKRAGQVLLDAGTRAVGNVVVATMNFLIMIFVLFFFIRDGELMLARLRYLLPLTESQEDRIFKQLDDVAKSVIMGSFIIAVCQGLVGGLGFFIAGIPPLFWGVMMGFASLIPVVGTAIIWLPAALYLMLTGDWQWGVFLLLWGGVLVSAIDSVLRPLLMKNRSKMSMFSVFLAVIGGVKFFGALGILYGPLILSFAMVVLTLYAEDFKDVLDGR